jgi:hypothetical protein
MKKMSTSLRSEIAEIKNLILNMLANKRTKTKEAQRLRSSLDILSRTRGRKIYGSV